MEVCFFVEILDCNQYIYRFFVAEFSPCLEMLKFGRCFMTINVINAFVLKAGERAKNSHVVLCQMASVTKR